MRSASHKSHGNGMVANSLSWQGEGWGDGVYTNATKSHMSVITANTAALTINRYGT